MSPSHTWSVCAPRSTSMPSSGGGGVDLHVDLLAGGCIESRAPPHRLCRGRGPEAPVATGVVSVDGDRLRDRHRASGHSAGEISGAGVLLHVVGRGLVGVLVIDVDDGTLDGVILRGEGAFLGGDDRGRRWLQDVRLGEIRGEREGRKSIAKSTVSACGVQLDQGSWARRRRVRRGVRALCGRGAGPGAAPRKSAERRCRRRPW